MTQEYSIFGDTNFFEDSILTRRGERRRKVDTRIFVLDGTLAVIVEGHRHLVHKWDEFIVPPGRWHWLEAITDCKYLQRVDFSEEEEEERAINESSDSKYET